MYTSFSAHTYDANVFAAVATRRESRGTSLLGAFDAPSDAHDCTRRGSTAVIRKLHTSPRIAREPRGDGAREWRAVPWVSAVTYADRTRAACPWCIRWTSARAVSCARSAAVLAKGRTRHAVGARRVPMNPA